MESNDAIVTYLKHTLPNISQDSIDLYKSLTTLKTFKKGDTIINYGSVSNSTYIIKEGFGASFIRKPDGSDFIRAIFKKYEPIGSLQSIINQKKTNATYKALTDFEAFEVKNSEFKSVKTPEFRQLYLKTLEKVYMKSEKRITELSQFDATQRYNELKKEIPGIDNLLPQYQIANYLNITSVQLSRIRRKIVGL